MGQGERGARKGEARKAEESRGRERSGARRSGASKVDARTVQKKPTGRFVWKGYLVFWTNCEGGRLEPLSTFLDKLRRERRLDLPSIKVEALAEPVDNRGILQAFQWLTGERGF